MWTTISKILLQLVMTIISDKVIVDGAKKMITKAVDSGVENVGITNSDAKDIINTITKSTLNTLEDTLLDNIK